METEALALAAAAAAVDGDYVTAHNLRAQMEVQSRFFNLAWKMYTEPSHEGARIATPVGEGHRGYCPSPLLGHSFCMQHQVIGRLTIRATEAAACMRGVPYSCLDPAAGLVTRHTDKCCL
jgi:hypothetical protein